MANHDARRRGFTLVELMVSMSLLSVIGLLLVSMTGSASNMWRYTTSRIEQFRGASAAFESVTRKLGQATLNTYWGYDNINAPTKYQRQSDLRFITGQSETLIGADQKRPTHCIFFQAPLGFVENTTTTASGDTGPNYFGGLPNLLNTWGYYVEFKSDVRPSFINNMSGAPPAKWRLRLMELMQPSNNLTVYKYTSTGSSSRDWFKLPVQSGTAAHVLAENIIALIILPKLSKADAQTAGVTDTEGTKLAPNFSYDSTQTNTTNAALDPFNQLPPVVQVTMVAIDAQSADRADRGTSLPAFSNQLYAPYFTDATRLSSDLNALQSALASQHLSTRVFTTSVAVHGAKWSRR